jgi:hypothetical protein
VRAYHRIDPLMDERKSHYTPAQLGAFLKVQLVAGRQSRPGYFRSVEHLRRCLPADYVRHVDFLVEQGDVLKVDGSAYIDGWTEWQEGDLTVGERMTRLRNRRRNAAVTLGVTPPVTEPSPAAIGVGISVSVSDVLPLAPTSGGGSRKDGTNPRAIARRKAEEVRWRRNQLKVQYAGGQLTEAEYRERIEALA